MFLLWFASQGCAGLCIRIVFCNSGLSWFVVELLRCSAYSYYVLHLRVVLVCLILLHFLNSDSYWSDIYIVRSSIF